jgi:predicted RNA binding protein YcfA (HicA-like mRNA interferase family)
VREILEAYGYSLVRTRGGHMIMQYSGGRATITVLVPRYREIAIGTPSSIIRRSGLLRGLFEGDG